MDKMQGCRATCSWLIPLALPSTIPSAHFVEIGDKTQIATVVLAAKYDEALWVIIGTTLGMLAANVPVVYAGKWVMDRLPLKYARISAFLFFLLMALFTASTALVR